MIDVKPVAWQRFDEWEHGKADGAELCRDALKTKGDTQ